MLINNVTTNYIVHEYMLNNYGHEMISTTSMPETSMQVAIDFLYSWSFMNSHNDMTSRVELVLPYDHIAFSVTPKDTMQDFIETCDEYIPDVVHSMIKEYNACKNDEEIDEYNIKWD